jgi:hypothetical protein
MTSPDAPHRDALMARLAQSRVEISRLLEPSPESANGDAGEGPGGLGEGFPRSRTMRALMSGRGIGAIGAMAGGLLLARPRVAWRLLRLLPTGAVARMVMGRVVGAMRGKR